MAGAPGADFQGGNWCKSKNGTKAYPHRGAGYKGGKRLLPGWPARSDDSMLMSSLACKAGASSPLLQTGMQLNTILAARRMSSVVMRLRNRSSTARWVLEPSRRTMRFETVVSICSAAG